MAFGFVYVLSNEVMPGVYKIGMTEGSPAKRANELSSSTSVPMSFEVVCYAEVTDCQAAEREMHEKFDEYRVSSNREFFKCPVEWIGAAMQDLYHLLQFQPGELDYVGYHEGDMFAKLIAYVATQKAAEGAEDENADESEAAPTTGGLE